ncbi:MAG: metallophosphoesterase [Pirellulales bacterium]|nr:metallophosphoesterase [Pirellulales bacterium]
MDLSRMNRREWNGLALAGLGGCLLGRTAWAAETPEEGDQFGEPLPFVEGSFTIAALPDTQVYCERYPQHFYQQTEWIAANKDARDIQFVLHLGDITNRNTKEQWEVAQRAMQTLDGVVPYSLSLGNHDYGPGGNATTRETFMNDYFPLAKARQQKSLAGLFDEQRLDNSYHLFNTRGQDFLVLALEWGPRDEVVAWAHEVAAKYPDHKKILTTHAYMYYDETRYDWEKYGKKQTWNPHSYGTAQLEGGTNDGEELWNKLVAKNGNFFLTVNGHVLRDGLGRMTSSHPAGGDVHQHLVNYQMKEEGGQAFLRLYEFLPDGETLQVKAYSPSTDQYKIDAQNQFVVKLNPAWKWA